MSIWFKKEVKDSLANRCILMFSGADALSAVAALTSAHLIRFKVISGGVLNHPHLITFLIIISGSLLFLLNIRLFNGYSPHTLMRLKSNYLVVFKSSLLWLIVLPSVTLFIEVLPSVSRGFIMIASFLLFIMVLGGRLVLLIILRKLQVITALRQRILFIDWSPKAELLAEKIFTDRYHPYKIAGIAPPPGDHFSHPPSMQHPILGSNKEIDQLFKQGLIQIAILADVDRNQKTIASIISLCERHLVTFMMIPLNFQILLTGLQVTTSVGFLFWESRSYHWKNHFFPQ
jgi:FlaA1/EpsC-like NDP-sugar epimerase